jgi:AMP-polyphosphate phosphotransferase
LWRFWRHIPRAGRFTIYDRSWYGRVLVERVEGFASEDAWVRAYREINEFEEELTDHGIVLVKFWVHIDKDEQFARFKAREETSFKQHKLTEEDWRNREKWDDYAHAVNDMVERTSTEFAPWNLIEGNDKRWARVRALQILCERLEKAL